MKIKGNIVAIVLIISWASQLIYLFPIPQMELSDSVHAIKEDIIKDNLWITEESEESDTKDNASEIYRELWDAWLTSLLILSVGIISALLGFKKYKYWCIFAMLPITYYLAIWYHLGSTDSVPFVKAMQLKWLAATTLETELVFFHKDVLLPLVFALFVIWCIISRFIRYYKTKESGIN